MIYLLCMSFNKIVLLLENNVDQLTKYWLVMEYADSGTLRNYLKEHSDGLTWEDKYNLAYQLACAVLCLHDEGIVHRDLVISVI
jgi:serine/threonine protein kinase